MKPGVVRLLAAKAVSDVGTALDLICLSLFAWLQTESMLATAGVGLMMYGGGFLGGRLAHRFGDTWDRRRIMIGADLLRAAVLLPLAVVPGDWQIFLLYPAVLLVGASSTVFGGTLAAAVPVLAGSRAQLMNSIIQGMTGVSRIVGMGLSAVIIGYVGFRGVFVIDASTYVLSAIVLLTLRLPMRDGSPGKQPAGNHANWALLVAAGIAAPLVVRGLDAFGSSSQHVGLPVLGAQLDPADPASVTGTLWMAWAIGVVTASFGLRPLIRSAIDRAPAAVFYGGTVLMSIGFAGMFWMPSWPGRLASAVLAGIGDALTEVAFKQSLQRLPDDRRGGAFGLSHMVINGGFLSGLAVTGLLVTPGLVGEWVLLLHGVPTVAACYALLTHRKREREEARV
ncbi:MFS transporter [Longispora albida]|uniref:MFS transporter n=1 Tax=Longispora albida TaxID=203523 RepID=UPI00036B7746|nr:MFS transporter [Longispora albida]